MRTLSLCLSLVFLSACPPAPTGGGEARTVSREISQALSLPPAPAARGAVARLEKDAGQGSCPAAWLRARYLVDLFDAVRLLPDDPRYAGAGLALLWSSLGLPGTPGRGRLATEQVMKALRRSIEAVPGGCPERAAADTALKLLDADGMDRSTLAGSTKVTVAYKRIAQSSSPVSPNAWLRLFDWCAKAFRLAAGGNPDRQHQRLNQCLFPLFPADPSPYFNADVNLRPPAPPWLVLKARLMKGRERLRATRLKDPAARLEKLDAAFFSVAAAALPTPLNLAVVTPPRGEVSVPWNRTPVVVISDKGFMVGGVALFKDDVEGLERAIAKRLHNDDRRRVTVVAAGSCPAPQILAVGRAARRAGAVTMDLGVARKVADRPTPGDIQAVVFGDKPVLRLEGIPVHLGLLSAISGAVPSRHQPRGMGYDPRTAKNGLGIILGRAGLRISSREGRLAPVRLRQLEAELRLLRTVYPNDRSLVIAPDNSATYGELVAVAEAVRGTVDRPLYPGLALVSPGKISPPEDNLAVIIRLLSRARVELEPQISRSWPLMLRGCYLTALRGSMMGKRPPPQGTLVLKVSAARIKVVGGRMKNKELRRCVELRLSTQKRPDPMKITATFSIR